MTRYAEKTSVPIERSEAEIRGLVARYGARRYMSGTDEDIGLSVIQFEMHDRRVQFRLQLPRPDDRQFQTTESGRARTPAQARSAYDQECRRLWRALVLTIKSKLESVESGIESFEEAFLPQIVLPGGTTFGQFAIPQIAHVYESGELPALLPGVSTPLALGDGSLP